MEKGNGPTIKESFVMSHVAALMREKGEAAVVELERRFGKPIRFAGRDDVPVHDEIVIIEHALDIASDDTVPKERRAEEVGKLHFRNFATTPLAKLVLPFLKSKFKLLMMQANNLAGHVFRGVRFTSEEKGPSEVRITMDNNDYPIEHFRGFFEEWMAYSGLVGEVSAEDLGGGTYAYSIRWRE